jgi:hypothetical protein
MGQVKTQPSIGTQTESTAPSAFFAPKGSPATLVSVLLDNAGLAQWLQFWDATGKTDDNARQLWGTRVPAMGFLSLDTPIFFKRGIYLRLATMRRNTAAELAADTNLGGITDGEWVTRHI